MDSVREASKILQDPDWKDLPNLISLPNDPQTVRAFAESDNLVMDGSIREKISELIHQEYLTMMEKKRKKAPDSVSLYDWKNLPDNLKESNRKQADHIFLKLKAIRYTIQEIKYRKANIIKFTDKEIELLSEMEHGWFNAEQFEDGWKFGPMKDISQKISPYLVPWD